MSGRNDFDVSEKDSIVLSIYCFDDFDVYFRSYRSSLDFFLASLVRSKPPPVCSYLRACLYCCYLSLAYSCYFICFLRASSALLCVSLLLSSSYCSFLSLSSSNLFLSSSTFLRLSSSFNFFSAMFFSDNSPSLAERSILSYCWHKRVYSKTT
jgi:hypothetical protein